MSYFYSRMRKNAFLYVKIYTRFDKKCESFLIPYVSPHRAGIIRKMYLCADRGKTHLQDLIFYDKISIA